MSAAVSNPPATRPGHGRRALFLVFSCTLIGALAQILIKTGTNTLSHPGLLSMLTNLPLLAGYGLLGLNTVLLTLALREGQLSLLYPIISLTYVWVAILSALYFHESISAFKAAGIAIIVLGVAVLGRDSRS